MRFLHSADWQIGARFGRFGTRAQHLREARIRTFYRALAVAREREVDAFLIAGDLFEDHQVEPAAIRAIYDAIRENSSVRVFIVPGNHDPASGPASIWCRPPFSQPLSNLKVFTASEVFPLGPSEWLLASPLMQKRSTIDPSLRFVELAGELPHDSIKVGLTHGALAIGGMHAVDDFPIALDAATRAGLDYVAIGHWHSSLACDNGRLFMPGTPEPTDFGENGSGNVHLVEIDTPGASPRIEAIRVAELTWVDVLCEGLSPDETFAQVKQALAGKDEHCSCIVRVTLRGECSEENLDAIITGCGELLEGCARYEVRDQTEPATSSEEEAKARADHPLLAGVLDDLAALTGNGDAPRMADPVMADLCRRLNCDAADLTPDVALAARRLLLSHLRDCEKPC